MKAGKLPRTLLLLRYFSSVKVHQALRGLETLFEGQGREYGREGQGQPVSVRECTGVRVCARQERERENIPECSTNPQEVA